MNRKFYVRVILIFAPHARKFNLDKTLLFVF